ncbi:MAG: D-TA family PLP-dependent enzyme, partial [Aestuariivirga sp.]
ATVYDANEEHGFVDATQLGEPPRIGDLLRIVPNHVCPVSNLFDKVVFVRDGKVLGAMRVDARGCVQ